MKVYLAVPYAEKDQAKALGARWDPQERRWFVGENTELAPFEPWLPETAAPGGDTIRLKVMLVPVECYRCHRAIKCVVGVRLPEGYDGAVSGAIDDVTYLDVEECGTNPVLRSRLDSALRGRVAVGPLEYRHTRPRRDAYLANTCIHCGATQGSFPLREEVISFVDGDPDRIACLWDDDVEVEFPVAALARD